jgi:hypothetical protein
MHSALVSSPPIYIPVCRLPDVTPDSPIYGTGTTGAFMSFGDAWMADLMLDDGPTLQELSPFEELCATVEDKSRDDLSPYTDVDELDIVMMEDFLEEMNDIDAALDALFSDEHVTEKLAADEDHRMYLVDRDGNRRYFDSGTALHAAARSQPRRTSTRCP